MSFHVFSSKTHKVTSLTLNNMASYIVTTYMHSVKAQYKNFSQPHSGITALWLLKFILGTRKQHQSTGSSEQFSYLQGWVVINSILLPEVTATMWLLKAKSRCETLTLSKESWWFYYSFFLRDWQCGFEKDNLSVCLLLSIPYFAGALDAGAAWLSTLGS